MLKEQLVTKTTASSIRHVSWQIEVEQTCGGQNLAVSSTDVRGSVWGCSQSSQDKGHLYRFSCTVAAGEHRTSWVVHLRMSGNHWLVKSSFYPTHNAEAQNGPAAGLFPPHKWNAPWSSSTAAFRNCDVTSVMASHTSRKKMYTSREYSRTTLESDFQEMAGTIIFSTMLNNQEPQGFVISVYFFIYKNESPFCFAR